MHLTKLEQNTSCFICLIKKKMLSEILNNSHICLHDTDKKKYVIICNARGSFESTQLTLNYYGLLPVSPVFIVFSLNDMASKCT